MMNTKSRIEFGGGSSLRRVAYLPFEARYRGMTIEEIWTEVEKEMGMKREKIEELLLEYEAEKEMQ